jgi:hypothetical protein
MEERDALQEEQVQPEEGHAEGLHQLDMNADLDGEVGGFIPTFIEQADRLDHAEAETSESEDELRDAEVEAHMLATGKVRTRACPRMNSIRHCHHHHHHLHGSPQRALSAACPKPPAQKGLQWSGGQRLHS